MALQREALKWPKWTSRKHPVYWLEVARTGYNQGTLVIARAFLPVVLAFTGLAALIIIAATILPGAFWSVENAFGGAIALLLVVFSLEQVLVGGVANVLMVTRTAPLISGEVETQSWDLLRTTTLSLREILYSKIAASMRQLRDTLFGLVALRLTTTLTALLGLMFLLRDGIYWSRDTWQLFFSNGVLVLPGLAISLFIMWYALQPVIQYALNASLGLVMSSAARTRSRSIAMALGARLALWVFSVSINTVLIYGLIYLVLNNWASPMYAPLAIFRGRATPSEELVITVMALTAFVYVLTILILQILSIAGALRFAENRARKLGE
nr:hypothetical protein [Anaerolineae bacterium]